MDAAQLGVCRSRKRKENEMKHNSKHIFALLMLSTMIILQSRPVYAISKLDFFSQLENTNKKVQKIKEQWEERYNKAMSDLEAKVEKAGGQEGKALFNMMRTQMEGDAKNIADNVKNNAKNGNFNLKDSVKGVTQKYANTKLDLATANSLLGDYKHALAQERSKKEQEIRTKIATLEAEEQLPSTKTDADRLKKIAEEKADLAMQLKALEDKDLQKDKKMQAMEKQIQQYADKAGKLSKEIFDEGGKAYMEKATDALFAAAEEDEENEKTEEMYATDYKDFFLGKYEKESSENIARIRYKRQKEYYLALQNLMRVIIIGSAKGKNIADSSENYLVRTTGGETKDGKKVNAPDGIFGGMSMKIGADVQNAKIAARYTEILLAQMRFNTMSEIILWNDKYKLGDYNKDFTKFNLDDYVNKKKSMMDKLKDKATGAVQDKISNYGF